MITFFISKRIFAVCFFYRHTNLLIFMQLKAAVYNYYNDKRNNIFNIPYFFIINYMYIILNLFLNKLFLVNFFI